MTKQEEPVPVRDVAWWHYAKIEVIPPPPPPPHTHTHTHTHTLTGEVASPLVSPRKAPMIVEEGEVEGKEEGGRGEEEGGGGTSSLNVSLVPHPDHTPPTFSMELATTPLSTALQGLNREHPVDRDSPVTSVLH